MPLTVKFNGVDIFQFTPLREGLPHQNTNPSMSDYFNSRPCERGFRIRSLHGLQADISIHAPARGASKRSNDVCTSD